MMALGALASRPAWAQIGGAEINGLVTDAQSAPVPGATVTATNTATGVSRIAVSTGTGGYALSGLSPGVYTVDVRLSGFRSVRHEDVRVQTGVTMRLDVALMVGDVSEAITVTAATPALRSSASLGQVVSEEAVTLLPLNGRSFVTLASMPFRNSRSRRTAHRRNSAASMAASSI
jgi:hypothetical protein